MKVTQKDIAERLGVSRQIVGYALNNHPAVSEETAKRVLETAEEMGYVPNRSAQSLVSGKFGVVQVIVPEFSYYYCDLLAFLTRALANAGQETMVFDFDSLGSVKGNDRFLPFSADGLIVVDTIQFIRRLQKAKWASRMPLLIMGSYPVDGIDFVGIDRQEATRQKIIPFVARGYRRIALLFDAREEATADCQATYRRVIAAAGLQAEVINADCPLPEVTADAVRQHIEEHGHPQAIVCFNDSMALGCYSALRKLGLQIPEDVALISSDGPHLLPFLETPISAVVTPLQEICNAAVETLMDRMEKIDRPPVRRIFETVFVDRASVGTPAEPLSAVVAGK